MKILGFNITRANRTKYKFTDADNELAAETRRMRRERAQLRHKIELEKDRADLEELRRELDEARDYDFEEDETQFDSSKMIEQFALQQFLKIMQSKSSSDDAPTSMWPASDHSGPMAPEQPAASGVSDVSDEDIQTLIENIPKNHKKLAKNMPDSILKAYILKQYAITPTTANRAVEMFRSMET